MNKLLSRFFLVAVILLSYTPYNSLGSQEGKVAISPYELRIEILDVGHGDSILITSPSGKVALVDSGPFNGSRGIVQTLKRKGVNRINYLIATHPHADHIGGMDNILEQLEVETVLDSGVPYSSATYQRLLKNIENKSINYVKVSIGQTFDLDANVVLRVLNPPERNNWITIRSGSNGKPDPNANSIILKIEYRDFSMLLMGDARVETEAALLKRKVNLRAQILKVGYHGSINASSEAFLKASQVQEAIISCGEDNRFGHPRQETLDRIRDRKIRLFRTDLQGAILIKTDGKEYRVLPSRRVSNAILFLGRKLFSEQPEIP